MTCERQRRCCGCKAVVRNDMRKTEALLRLQEHFPAVHPMRCQNWLRIIHKHLCCKKKAALHDGDIHHAAPVVCTSIFLFIMGVQ